MILKDAMGNYIQFSLPFQNSFIVGLFIYLVILGSGGCWVAISCISPFLSGHTIWDGLTAEANSNDNLFDDRREMKTEASLKV